MRYRSEFLTFVSLLGLVRSASEHDGKSDGTARLKVMISPNGALQAEHSPSLPVNDKAKLHSFLNELSHERKIRGDDSTQVDQGVDQTANERYAAAAWILPKDLHAPQLTSSEFQASPASPPDESHGALHAGAHWLSKRNQLHRFSRRHGDTIAYDEKPGTSTLDDELAEEAMSASLRVHQDPEIGADDVTPGSRYAASSWLLSKSMYVPRVVANSTSGSAERSIAENQEASAWLRKQLTKQLLRREADEVDLLSDKADPIDSTAFQISTAPPADEDDSNESLPQSPAYLGLHRRRRGIAIAVPSPKSTGEAGGRHWWLLIGLPLLLLILAFVYVVVPIIRKKLRPNDRWRHYQFEFKKELPSEEQGTFEQEQEPSEQEQEPSEQLESDNPSSSFPSLPNPDPPDSWSQSAVPCASGRAPSQGQKVLLVVSVIKGEQMPEVNTLGGCDPFVEVRIHSGTEDPIKNSNIARPLRPTWSVQTQPKPNERAPLWNETLELVDCTVSAETYVHMILQSWDLARAIQVAHTSMNINKALDKLTFVADANVSQENKFRLKFKSLLGAQYKMNCNPLVDIKISYLEVTKFKINVIKACKLPQVKQLMGTIDSYVECRIVRGNPLKMTFGRFPNKDKDQPGLCLWQGTTPVMANNNEPQYDKNFSDAEVPAYGDIYLQLILWDSNYPLLDTPIAHQAMNLRDVMGKPPDTLAESELKFQKLEGWDKVASFKHAKLSVSIAYSIVMDETA